MYEFSTMHKFDSFDNLMDNKAIMDILQYFLPKLEYLCTQ